MTELKDKIVDQSAGLLEKAYDDIAHPSAKSVGNTISLIPRTVGVLLGKWEKWVINGEESIRLTVNAVKERAAAIPEEKLTEPEPYVAVPAIQQLSYSYDSEELRTLYANLLVSSMNTDTKYKVHPSFVDIIKQLTPDEAKLLKAIPSTTMGYKPLVDLQLNLGVGRGHISVLRNYTNIGEGVCDSPENICEYIENLDRLKILCVLEDIHVTDANMYVPLENSTFFVGLKNGIPLSDGQSLATKKKSFYITEFGKSFVDICVN